MKLLTRDSEHKWERHADTHTANLPYVNVGGQQEGTKVWYPADKLWILPYQRLDDQLPTDLIPDMIRFACPKPGTNRHLLHVFAKEALMLAPKARLNPADPLDLTTPVEIVGSKFESHLPIADLLIFSQDSWHQSDRLYG